jgi:hypothetical protein
MTEDAAAAVSHLRASDRAAAVLRRSEQACFSSANDDEVGGSQSAIRSERSEQLNTVSRADVLRRSERRRFFLCERRRSGRLAARCASRRTK